MPQRDLLNSSDNHGDNRANLVSALIGGVGLYHRATKPMHDDTQPTSTDYNANKAFRLQAITDYENASGGIHHAMRPMTTPNVTADLDTFGTQDGYTKKDPPPVEWADGPIKDVQLRLHEVQTTSMEAEVHQNEPQVRLMKNWQHQTFHFSVPRGQFGEPVEVIQKMDLRGGGVRAFDGRDVCFREAAHEGAVQVAGLHHSLPCPPFRILAAPAKSIACSRGRIFISDLFEHETVAQQQPRRALVLHHAAKQGAKRRLIRRGAGLVLIEFLQQFLCPKRAVSCPATRLKLGDAPRQ